jgi:hypothetical protein
VEETCHHTVYSTIAHLVYKPDICGVFCGLCFSTRGVLDTTICDKVCKKLAAGRSFSTGALVFSINKTALLVFWQAQAL